MEKLPLKVMYGTIYTQHDTGIDNIAVILDKQAGLLKYGELSDLEETYKEITERFLRAGLKECADDTVFISFDRYQGILSIKEICTFVNYMILCSANGDKIFQILSMTPEEIKTEIKRLSFLGF